MDVKRMDGSTGAAGISMAQKMPRKVAHRSLAGPPTSNLGTQKAQEHMHLERCHRAAPFLLMV
jgi:hypothetical protein